MNDKDKQLSSSQLQSDPLFEELNEDITYPQKGIVDIDRRLEQIEKMVDVAQEVAGQAIKSWENNQKRKANNQQKELLIKNDQHKRITWILTSILTAIFILCLISMFMKQYDLTKLILNSSLAIAAGAGLSTFVQNKNKDK